MERSNGHFIRPRVCRKKGKANTVMCRYMLRDGWCSRGERCRFAHSKMEIDLVETSFAEASRWGLDYEALRSHLCLDFVSTGKCLFGDICNGLHDPRIAVEPEKLKLVKIKSLQFPDDKHSTDVDIDYRRASKIYEVNYGPFGQLTPVMLSNFGDFKNTVCNTPHFYPSAFTDKQRIQIAIFFYKSRSFENFRFKATHHIDGNFACMVVQKKLFFVTERGVQEIKDTKSVPHLENENIISVHELAFAQETPSYSDFDPMKPAPGLWFNIPDVILRKTTAYDVKQITLENKKFDLSSEETDFFDTYCTHVSNPERPFYVFYTRRGDSSGIYDLIIQTLCHAVGVDRLALTSPKEKFQSAKRALQLDYWPASAGKLTNSISSDNIGYAAREYSLRDKDEKKMMYDSFCSNLDGGQSSYTTGSTNGRSRFVDLFDELADQKYIQDQGQDDDRYRLGKNDFVEQLFNPKNAWETIVTKYQNEGMIY